MSKSVFDLTLEELNDIGRRATEDALREAREAGVPVVTFAPLNASNVTPIKAKRTSSKSPTRPAAKPSLSGARAGKGA